ncbi:hypothetical protein DFQ30_005553 [Apophysomyces sp. BC1015]|nr:hypothetical protein DFQ30_005553 [Apophysomyces sp. BC1015]
MGVTLSFFQDVLFSIGSDQYQSLNDHNSLDISQDFEVSSTYSAWNNLAPRNFVLEPNCLFPIVPLRRLTGYLIYGGLASNNTHPLNNITTVYHADTDTWTTVETHTYQVRGAFASLDATDRIWIWGGVSEMATGYPNGIGYWDGFTILDPSFMWQGVDTSRMNSVPQGVRRIGSTSTLSTDNNIIYYIGGYNAFLNSSINQTATGINPYTLNAARMSDILAFNTVNVTWALITAGGSQIPSPREYHTSVRVPDSDTLLMYGGAAPGDPNNPTATADDYFYTLNMSTFIWTQVTNLGPSAGAGPRFGHSAIVRNNSMFILFGKDGKGNEKNDFHVMDLVHKQWTNSYLASGLYGQSGGSDQPTNSIPSISTSSSSNVGAIVGGVVGGVGGIAAIAGLIAFFMIRKKKKAARNASPMPTGTATSGSGGHNLSGSKDLEKSPSLYNGTKQDIESSIPASGSPHDDQYYTDSDIKRRQETTPFIENPVPPYNEDFASEHHHQQQQQQQSQQQASYIMTPTEPSGIIGLGGDPESDKPDGHVPRFTLEPVKPDGI